MIGEILEVTELPRNEISNLLPLVLMEVRNYTNQYFLTTKSSQVESISSDRIMVKDSNIFQADDTIEIINSDNTGIFTIKEVGEGYLLVDQYLTVESDLTSARVIKLVFRGVNPHTVMSMLSHLNSESSDRVVISQSQGSRSVTYADTSAYQTLLPPNLYGSLQALRKLNDDGKEYARKGYELNVLY